MGKSKGKQDRKKLRGTLGSGKGAGGGESRTVDVQDECTMDIWKYHRKSTNVQCASDRNKVSKTYASFLQLTKFIKTENDKTGYCEEFD